MIFDLVVDTNVFLHSTDTRQQLCAPAKQFLAKLLAGATFLCIDEGFDMDESKNRSVIGSEYFDKLRFVDAAFAIITALGGKGRILKLPKAVDPRAGKKIRQLVRNKTDRTFLKVSYNSQCRTFVSHDFEDLPAAKRVVIAREIGVASVNAVEACNLV